MRRLFRALLALGLCVCLWMGGALAEESASEILYVYVTACESCARVGELLDKLPASLPLADGSGETDVEVERLNLADDVGRVQALFEQYGVPEEDQIAPIVFLGTEYLSGAEAIEANLVEWITQGRAIAHLPASDAGESQADVSALSWAATVAAGLVGGLNPCALSMLLLFLTTVMSVRERPGRYAAAFLASKFAVYLLIGTALLNALRAWNPSWLPMAAKWLLTLLGAGLIALNLMDAVAARREAFGQIRNQLPSGVRAFLHGRIRAMLGGRFLLIAVVALGAIVAASEFLCAGQVYLATLLTAVQSDLSTLRWTLMLVVYCVAFLVPSIAITVLVVAGRNLISISDWLMEHMSAVKILTAVALAAMIVLAWLL